MQHCCYMRCALERKLVNVYHTVWAREKACQCVLHCVLERKLVSVYYTVSDLFSLRSWRRKLHIWSPNYTSTLALHKLRKWLRFGYTIATCVTDSVLFFDAILFLTRPPCSKGMWARLWFVRIKSCNSNAGFDANIGSEHSRNSLQFGENVRVEEASVWNFRRRLSISLQRLCYCD